MQITTGKNKRAQKIVVYGPEGIGKSTFVSKFPQALFSDVEGSTDELDVARLPKPSSWEMLLQQGQYLKNNPHLCRTWVIDTADWAEKLCAEHICSKSKKEGIEDFGYGKGYVYLEEEFGRLLNLCSDLLEVGINVVFTAHAQMRKFEQPDEMGAYDRWELKLQKKTAPLLKEWADAVFFCNYKTYVVKTDDKKAKAQGGSRVMYTSHHPCWDAKNRYGLDDEIVDFKFESIAHCIPLIGAQKQNVQPTAPQSEREVTYWHHPESSCVYVAEKGHIPGDPLCEEIEKEQYEKLKKEYESLEKTPEAPISKKEFENESEKQEETVSHPAGNDLSGIPRPLADLMKSNHVTPEAIQKAVAQKGYYPQNTPIANYDPEFVSGVLVAAWPQVHQLIKQLEDVPF